MGCAGFAVAAFIAWTLGGPFGRYLASKGLVRSNYQGKEIPTVYGALLLMAALPVYLYSASMQAERGAAYPYIVAAVSFCGLGLADDVWGDRSVGGFKGHFRKLLKEGKLTTGAAKALLGATMAFGLAYSLFPRQPLDVAVTGLLIALTANALNLVDTRPVRATAIFLLGSAIFAGVWIVYRSGVPVVFGAIPGATLGYLRVERAKQGMLGDAGSNLLGGVLGLSMGIALNLPVKIAGVVLLLGFHYFTERRSLNAWVREHRTLNRLDLWLQGPVWDEAGKT